MVFLKAGESWRRGQRAKKVILSFLFERQKERTERIKESWEEEGDLGRDHSRPFLVYFLVSLLVHFLSMMIHGYWDHVLYFSLMEVFLFG